MILLAIAENWTIEGVEYLELGGEGLEKQTHIIERVLRLHLVVLLVLFVLARHAVLVELVLGLGFQVRNKILQLLHQIIAQDINVEFGVGRVALGEDGLDGLAEFVVVLGDHALDNLELVDDLDALSHLDLCASDGHDEANEAGTVKDQFVHEDVEELHHGPLGIQEARNIAKVNISLFLLHEIWEEGLRYLLVADLESRQSLILVNYFPLAVLGIRSELEVLRTVDERGQHG